MSRQITLKLNGREVSVGEGTSIAAAMLNAGQPSRSSLCGEPRAPLCGMGVCMECRVVIDGASHRLGCQTLCAPGMEVHTE
jgi:predicted molibdopterin-dependent oxidoreductase YjgC